MRGPGDPDLRPRPLGRGRRDAHDPYPHADADVAPSGVVVTYAADPNEDATHVRVWGVGQTPAPLGAWHRPGANNSELVAVSPDGRAVAFSSDVYVRVVPTPPAVAPATSEMEVSNLRDLRFGPDGRLWSADRRGITCWDREAGPRLAHAAGPSPGTPPRPPPTPSACPPAYAGSSPSARPG